MRQPIRDANGHTPPALDGGLAPHVNYDLVVNRGAYPGVGLLLWRSQALWVLVVGLGVFVGAEVVVTVLSASPPPGASMLLVGGCGVLGLLTMAVARYDWMVGLAFVLSGVVIGVPTPSDLILFVVMAAAFATGRFQPRVPIVVGVSLGLFVATNMLATAAADDMQTAANYLLIVILLATMAVWVSGYIDTNRRARILVGAYLTAALIAAVIGSVALLFPVPGREIFLYGLDETSGLAQEGLRARALFDDPNVFGPFLMPIAIILLEDLLNPRLFRFGRGLKGGMLAVLLAGIVFSASRGAWIGTIVSLLVFTTVIAARRNGSRRVIPLLGGVAAAAMLVGTFVTLAGTQSDLSDRAKAQSYDVSRFSAQKQGLELAYEHPLGIGPGQFEAKASYGGQPIAAHSLFIRAFAEEGLPGLVALLAICLSTLAYGLRSAIRGLNLHGIGSASLLAAWSGILVHSYFVDSLQWRHAWLVAALIWATAIAGTRGGSASSGHLARS